MPALEEILPGLHRWTAPVSDWTPDQGGPEGWGQEVACVAWEADDGLVLIDPLVPEGDWGALDALARRCDGTVKLVITCPWHARSGGEAAARYVNSPGIETWAHEAAVEDRERIDFAVDHLAADRSRIAPGVEAFATDTGNGEITLWLERARAVIAADVLIGAEGERTEPLRVCPADWIEPEGSPQAVVSALRALLERPVEAVVPLHGAPVLHGAREALQEALDAAA